MGLDRGRGTDKVPAKGVTYQKSLGSPILTPPKFRRQLKLTTLSQNVEADYQFPSTISGVLYVQFRFQVHPPAIGDEPDANDVMHVGDGADNFVSVRRAAGDLVVSSSLAGGNLIASAIPYDTWVKVDLALTFSADGDVNVQVRLNDVDQGSLSAAGLVISAVQLGTWGFFTATHELDDLKVGTNGWGTTNVFEADFSSHTIVPPFDSLVDGALDASSGTLVVATDDGEPHYALKSIANAVQNFVYFELAQEKKDTARAELRTVQALLLPGNPLRSYKRTDKAQVETLNAELVPEFTPPPVLDYLTTTAEQEALGDGNSILTIGRVPSLFTEASYQAERPDAIVRRYRAIAPLLRRIELVAGTATQPSLAPGELTRDQDQVNEFVYRDLVQYRDLSLLPVSLTDYKMTRAKQVSTVVLTLDDDPMTIAPDYLTEEAEVQDLGDGTWLKTFGAVETLFTAKSSGIELPDLVPPEMRAHAPIYDTDLRVAGSIVDPPVLSTGDISKIEIQEDEFTKRVRTKTRNPLSLPVTLTNTQTTEEYGGGTLNLLYRLETQGSGTVDTGLLFTGSSIRDLGNGTEIKESRELDDSAWPVLAGQEYEDRFDVVLPFTQQVVDAGTGIGTARTQIKPIDLWRQENKFFDISDIGPILDAYSLVFPGTANIDSKLPHKLQNVASIFDHNLGTGDSTVSGTGSFTHRGSVSVPGSANASSSVAVVADATFDLLTPFFPNRFTTRVVFFLPNPVTSAAVLTKIGTILGGTVAAWPTYDPTPVTITCVSRKTATRQEGTCHIQIGGDDCAACGGDGTGNHTAESVLLTGDGHSTEVGVTIKVIRIPSCIHEGLSIADTNTQTADASATIGCSVGTVTTTASATGEVDCSATATSLTDWDPGTGFLYLLDCHAEAYKYGYAMVHAEVFNFSDL